MKKAKYNQKGVWACPVCWNAISCSCEVKEKYHEYFDSQAEYAYAIKLKEMEKRGLIRDLIHHPRIELAPAIFFLQKAGKYTPIADYNIAKKYPEYCVKVHDKIVYEADFQFTDATGVHFVEVKKLGLKGPFIPNLPAFRSKVELLEAVHGIELEIVTGAIKWRFVGKKLEAVK